MKLSQNGFTIVELLIVITIIGVLASVVIPRLQVARDEGLETKIKTELTAIGKRAAVEENIALTYDVVCGTNGYTQASSIVEQINQIESFSSITIECNSNPDAFAVSAPFNATNHWCVDSAGNRIVRGSGIGLSEFTCQ